MQEVLKFSPVDSFVLKGRGWRIYTGPCPIDGSSDEQDIRKWVGRQVEINGKTHRIVSVETHAIPRAPRLGEPIGIAVRDL